jgi:hypothetical protein
MKETYKFKKIDDIEVLLDDLQIFHRNCIDPKKCERDMMLRLKHKHQTMDEYNDIGYVDVFLTTYQAGQLIEKLASMLVTNELLYPKESK